MEGPYAGTITAGSQPRRSERWADWRLLLVLFALAGVVRCWLIGHTEVTARDGVGFIRYAWQLQTQDWRSVLRENPHPPFYPLTILAVSYPVRLIVPGDDCDVMQFSAQLTTALASTLLIFSMFFLGRDLFNRRIGFWAALLFQCFPASSRVLSDALSEGVFLLLAATAFLLALRAFRKNSPLHFGCIGLCGGLAYLTRPEGTLILAATGIVLAVRQLLPGTRQPWRPLLACGASLIVPALAVGVPYVAVIGQVTNKTTGLSVLQTASADPDKTLPLPSDGGIETDRQVGSHLVAAVWAVWGPGSKDFGFWSHQLWCLASLGREVVRGFHYVAWLPALLGLFWYRRRLRDVPGIWVALLVVVLHSLVLWRVAYVVGYVAERHGLLIVMVGMPWAVAGMMPLAEMLAAFWARAAAWLRWIPGWDQCARVLTNGPVLARVCLAILAVSGLPKTLEPLHTNRAGYHAAGLWLAAHARPDDQIMDPFCWAEYYAGQVFRRPSYNYDMTRAPRYVVLGGSKNEHERLPLIPYANELAKKGEVVYHWCPCQPRQRAEEVLVYRVSSPADAFQAPQPNP